MTVEQQSEYMKNVKWTTAGIVFSSTISLVVALVWFSSDIKSDIKDTRTEAREQLTAAVTSINKRIDSLQYKNNSDIKEIWMMISPSKQSSILTPQYPKMGLFTQKVINGKRIWVQVNK